MSEEKKSIDKDLAFDEKFNVRPKDLSYHNDENMVHESHKIQKIYRKKSWMLDNIFREHRISKHLSSNII